MPINALYVPKKSTFGNPGGATKRTKNKTGNDFER